jgi:hypothetical protein
MSNVKTSISTDSFKSKEITTNFIRVRAEYPLVAGSEYPKMIERKIFSTEEPEKVDAYINSLG